MPERAEVPGNQEEQIERILELAKKNKVSMVDFRFVDLPGAWQHLSTSVDMLTKEVFEEGISFDGSSIHGFKPIHESDMLMKPDANTAFIDPCVEEPTLSLTCNIFDPLTKKRYTRDSRYVAQKAEDFLRTTDITAADTAYFGPEAEFYIFDSVRYSSSANIQYAEVDAVEAHWNSASASKPNLGYFMQEKRGYFPVPPHDACQDLRTEIFLTLKALGVPVEAHHHEVGSAGQAEIRFHYSTLVETADRLLLYKYVARNVARRHGKTVTFMPKPVLDDNGSGLHTHQSLWQGTNPLFFDEKDTYAGISSLARFYIGGILKHASAILAIAAPTTNSYKRLVPGFEAPVNLVFSKGNRSAAIRVPLTDNPGSKRIKFRPPDPTANPYLLFSALLMAGLDGIKQKIDPSIPGFNADRDLYDLTGEQLEQITSVPRSLEESLLALENDCDFLLVGNVFTNDLLEKYIELKREQVDRVRKCPTPIEFSMYYGA